MTKREDKRKKGLKEVGVCVCVRMRVRVNATHCPRWWCPLGAYVVCSCVWMWMYERMYLVRGEREGVWFTKYNKIGHGWVIYYQADRQAGGAINNNYYFLVVGYQQKTTYAYFAWCFGLLPSFFLSGNRSLGIISGSHFTWGKEKEKRLGAAFVSCLNG